MKWEIRKYTPIDKEEWDKFVNEARNSTFLFNRAFMDYHSDRFEDCSLLAYRKGKLSALLPADRKGEELRSHHGLTYGGWILPASSSINGNEMLELWRKWLQWCSSNGIKSVLYKPLPYIYAEQPSDEDLYCLFRSGGILQRTNLSSAIRLERNPGLNKLQRRHIKGLENSVFNIKEYRGEIPSEILSKFYEMLQSCLHERHDAKAVHTAEEIALLSARFPENISLQVLEYKGKIEAGIWLFETSTCNHCQYIATTPLGRELNLMTPLTVHLIQEATKAGKNYFDFGISNEEGGKILNHGLLRHKSSFGATGIAYGEWSVNVEKGKTFFNDLDQ